MTTDNKTEIEEKEKDPWIPMVEEAMQKNKTAFENMIMNLIHSGLHEQSAEEKLVYPNVPPMLKKKLGCIYMERFLWMKQLKNDPVRKKIMQTKDAFVDNDDFDSEEAMEAVVDKRKFLIKRLVKDCNFDEGDDDEDE